MRQGIHSTAKLLILPAFAAGLLGLFWLVVAAFWVPSMTQIRQAATRRVRAHAVREIVFHCEHTTPRGINSLIEEASGGSSQARAPDPPQDQISRSQYRFVFAGHSYRQEHRFGESGAAAKAAPPGAGTVYIAHRGWSFMFHEPANEGKFKPGDPEGDALLLNQCLFMVANGEFGGYFREARAMRRATLDGVPCVVIGSDEFARRAPGSDLIRMEAWLDPAREYLPLRFRSVHTGGRTGAEVRLEFEGGREEGWKLVRMTQTMNNPSLGGALMMRTELKVVTWRANVPLGPEDFAFDIPDDARFRDSRGETTVAMRDGIQSDLDRWLQCVADNN